MSDYPKQMLFITALSGSGRLILVEVIGPNPRINGGLYIRYPEGGTDTTYPEFLFDIPEELTRLQSEVERLVSQNDKANNKNRELMAEVESLRGREADLEDECRNAQKYMVWLSGGKEVPTVRAWLLRKQAEEVEEAYKSTVLSTKGDHPKYEKGFDDAMNQYDGQMEKYVELLRQQADEAEKAGD